MNRAGSAAVYLGSLFNTDSEPSVAVVSNATSTIITFGTASSTPAKPVATTTKPATTKPKPVTTGPTYTTVQVNGPAAPTLHGLPDLAITATAIGYLNTTATDSFVASTTVPSGKLPAVKFTVKNIGTNMSGTWRFNAVVPTRTFYTYQSDLQQTLAPGDSIDYTLGFDRPKTGTGQQAVITVNHDKITNESSTNNNTLTLHFNIK